MIPRQIVAQSSEQEEIRELHRMLNLGTPALIGPNNERRNLPESVYHVLQDVVAQMMRGRTIVLTPQNNRLTTQAAANFLGFSRPHLIKLLEKGEIAFERVGQHRRIMFKDLLAYSKKRDAERRTAFNTLAQAERRDGMYEGVAIPDGGSDE